MNSTTNQQNMSPYRPFLARHAWVGFLIFILSSLAFIWLTIQVISNGPVTYSDLPIAKSVNAWAKLQPQPFVLLMRFFSAYGRDGVALITLILAVGWIRHKARRELWFLFFGVLGTELWFQVISNLVNRQRPEFKDAYETLIGAGYPSGHAATNLVLGGMILYLLLPHIKSAGRRALLIVVVVAYVLVVCFSRLFLGLHYPTDLIAGLLLGLAWGALIFTVTDLHFFDHRSTQPAAMMNPAAMPVTGQTDKKRTE
jgi:undecaprenyl-diphosphatase